MSTIATARDALDTAVRITNRKLRATSPPTWRSYRGLSILYDPPASAARSGLEPLEMAALTGPAVPLYEALRVVAGELRSCVRRLGSELCPLPPETYHVTLCDTVNQGNRAAVHEDLRDEVSRTLQQLPDSLLRPGALVRLLRDHEIHWDVWRHPVTLRVASLRVWGYALVATLEPVDERSADACRQHATSRRDLAKRLREVAGPEPPPWRPHVTLGYFPNRVAAAHLRDHMTPAWQAGMCAPTETRTITFGSCSLYGFTDMVSFWRLGR